MPRSTLPDFDPLTELGIGRPARNEPEAKPARQERRIEGKATPPIVSAAAPSEPVRTNSENVAAPVETSSQIPASQPTTAADSQRAQARVRPRLTLASSASADAAALKAKTSGRISAEVFDEVRDCVVWHGHAMTIDSFTEAAFREHLKRLRRLHDLGDRFPTREREPKQGRRVS